MSRLYESRASELTFCTALDSEQTARRDISSEDYVSFYKYFHGDNGADLGASNQTGWTGHRRKLIEFFGRIDGQQLLDAGKAAAFARKEPTRDMQVA